MPAPTEIVALVLAGAIVVVLLLLLRRALVAFQGAGFTLFEAALVLVVAPLASGVNVLVRDDGAAPLAVNVAGLLVPLVVSAKVVLERRVPRVRTALAVALVAVVAFERSHLVPGEGVRVLLVWPVLAAVALGLLFTLGDVSRAPLVAYVAGALGTLIGADLLRLPDLDALRPPPGSAMSIGGAGVLDAIFLAGALAVLLQIVLVGKRKRSRA